jgi:MFS family permease
LIKRSIAIDVTPLRESVPYRALWMGQMISLLGTHMRYVAVAYQVFLLTNSTVAVGMLGLAEVIPLIIFSIIGGAVADSTDRRSTMVKAQVGMMAASAALAVVSLQPNPSVVAIFALTAASSAISSVDRPARTAMIPGLVRPGQLPAALALRQVLFQTTQIAGPAVGGFLLASFDISWVYVIDALTFFAVVVALRWVPGGRPEPHGHDNQLQLIREGLRFAFSTPLILSIFVVDFVAMIFGMPRAVFPELAQETFGMGPSGLGLLYAAPSVGALLGALTTGWIGHVQRRGMAVLFAVTAWGVFMTAAGLSVFSVWATLTFLALAGASDVYSAVFRGTMLQESTPDSLRGRVSALNLMVVIGGPRLGDVEAGIVGGLIGAPASIIAGGIACLAGTGVVAVLFPALRRYTAPRAFDDAKGLA